MLCQRGGVIKKGFPRKGSIAWQRQKNYETEGRRLRSFTLAGEFFWTESWGPSTENAPTRNGWTHLNPEVMTGHMANGGFLSFCAFHLHSEEFISVPVTCESDDGTRATEQDVNPASWETTKPYFALARICLQRSCVKEK